MDTSQDAGTVTKAVVKPSSGRIRYVRVTNANAAARYFQLHNKATAPAGADTAAFWVQLPAGTAAAPSVTTIPRSEFDSGFPLTTGVSWAISTTATAFTDSATANEHTVTLFFS